MWKKVNMVNELNDDYGSYLVIVVQNFGDNNVTSSFLTLFHYKVHRKQGGRKERPKWEKAKKSKKKKPDNRVERETLTEWARKWR